VKAAYCESWWPKSKPTKYNNKSFSYSVQHVIIFHSPNHSLHATYLDPTEQPKPRFKKRILRCAYHWYVTLITKKKKNIFQGKRKQQIETFWLLFRHVSRIGKSWKTVLYNIFGRLSTSGEGIASFNRRGWHEILACHAIITLKFCLHFSIWC